MSITYKQDFEQYVGIKNAAGKSIFDKPQYPAKVQGVSDIIDQAEKTDVSMLRDFLLKDTRPLYVFGAGGSLSSATFAAKLATEHGIVAQTMTPMMIMQLPSTIVSQCRFLAIGASGKSADQIAALTYLLGINPEGVFALSLNGLDKYKRATALTKLMEANPKAKFLCTHWEMHGDGYVGTRNHVALLILVYRAFYPEVKGLKEQLIHPDETAFELTMSDDMDLKDIDTLHLLHAGMGEVAAIDLEGRCAECGIVATMVTDVKNFTHGRHTFVHTHPQNGIVMLSGPKDKPFGDAVLSTFRKYDHVVTVNISTKHEGALGAIELMIRTLYFALDLSYAKRVDIKKPAGKPKFGGELWKLEPGQTIEYYETRLKEIDKKMNSKTKKEED